MKKTILFRKGEVYFSVGFYDPDFKLPRIDTYVYCGVEDNEYLFIDATGHVTGKNEEMPDSAHYLSMPRDSKSTMLDKDSLLEWLAVEHTPTKPAAFEYEYKDT